MIKTPWEIVQEEIGDALDRALLHGDESARGVLNAMKDRMIQREEWWRRELAARATSWDLTAYLYQTYCEKVGGVAFNGDKLPTWEEFEADPAKQKSAAGWLGIGWAVYELLKANQPIENKQS